MRFKKRFVTPRIWKHSESANDCYFCILKRRKQTNKLSLYSYPATKTLPIPMEVYNLVSSSQPLSSQETVVSMYTEECPNHPIIITVY
ncbi:hypothetical protein A3Q56_00640 [Intoshia linei]|uniref:Uncharacterized protein n=1 Tax=Intoshia linei TaxID=1819745 RepID=A0A177BBJ9_9BILA|nr:hypothetical protein A3Q56_00640 [Intoshia linei]